MTEMIVFAILLLAAIGASLAWGEAQERWAAGIVVAAALLTPLAQTSGFLRAELGILSIDIMVLLALTQIGLTSGRYWPLAASAFQLNSVVMHLVWIIIPTVHSSVYANVTVFWSFLVVASLILGASWECRRLAQ